MSRDIRVSPCGAAAYKLFNKSKYSLVIGLERGSNVLIVFSFIGDIRTK